MKNTAFVVVWCVALVAGCDGEPVDPKSGVPAEPVTESSHDEPSGADQGNAPEDEALDRETPEDPVDLSVGRAWTTDDLAHVVPGTPALVRTVIYGTEPTDLRARYLGFTMNPITMGGADPYLLLETDPEDERWAGWGGPAAGMSGSPIIIEGRLAGALSFSFGSRRESPFPFIATPIEKMLAAGEDSSVWPDAPEDPDAEPTSAVFVVAGGRPQFTERLLTWRPNRFLVPSYLSHGATGSGRGNKSFLLPGDAISVNLVSGDMVSISGIGTVTALDGDRIFAFGHPMFGFGEISVPYSGAIINGITDDLYGGSKFGHALTPTLGVITEDRLAAIAGVVAAPADTVTVWTRLVLPDGEMRTWNHAVTRLPPGFFGSDLFVFPLLVPLDVAFDRIGPGSAEYELSIAFEESSAVAHRREIVSSMDIVGGLYFPIYGALAQFSEGGQVETTITNVTFTVSNVSQERRELTLFDAGIPEDGVMRDSVVSVSIKYYRPHGTTIEEFAVELSVPRNFPEGPATLEASALTNALYPGDLYSPMMGPPPIDGAGPGGGCDPVPPPLTVDELVAEFNKQPRTDVVEVRLTSMAMPEAGLPPEEFPPCEDKDPMNCPVSEPPPFDPCPEPPPPPPSVKVMLETGSVIMGFVSRPVEVVAPTD